MSQETDQMVINLLVNDEASAEFIDIANGAGNLKERIEVLKIAFESMRTTLGLTTREVADGVLAFDRLIAAADRAGEIGTLPRINAAALKAVTQQTVAAPEAAVEVAQTNALLVQEERRVALQNEEIENMLWLARLDADRAVAEEAAYGRMMQRAQLENAQFDKRIRDNGAIMAYADMDAEANQTQLEQTRQIQERELEGARVLQEQRMGQIASRAEADDLRIQHTQAKEISAQRELDFMRQNSARLQQISLMAPADQINPLARFFGDARTAGMDMKVILEQIGLQFKNILPQEIQKANKELSNMKNGFWNMAKEAFNLSAIMNTMFGVGMAMIIFQLSQLVTNFFTSTIQQVKDLEAAISSLSATEAAMSRSGISVTGRDLLDLVSELEKKWTNIGRTDLMKATGDLGFKLSDKGINLKELQDLMDVILAVQVRNPTKKFNEVATMFSQATLSNNYEGVGGLGYTTSADSIQKAALEAGIISDINQKLTDQEEIRAKIYQWKTKELNDEKETLAMQENLSNASNKLKASWENLAEKLSPVVDIWNLFLVILANNLDTVITLIQLWGTGLEIVFGWYAKLLNIVPAIPDVAAGIVNKTNEYVFGKEASKQIFGNQPSVEKLAKQDTPTDLSGLGAIPDSMAASTEDNTKKMQKWLNDVAEAMDTFADKAKKMQEDYDVSMKKMADDNSLAQTRFLQDWAIDRAKIISDSNDEAAKKEKDYQSKQLDEEAKFQEQLRQLREKYLMSLEDALHERDARQVLRLAREYAMNKQNMLNEHALKGNTDAASHADDMAQAAKQTADKLSALDAERALRLARMKEDYKINYDRAVAAHRLDMRRLEDEKQDKLRQLSTSLAEQLNLTTAGAKAIYNALNSYFGPGGGIAKMMTWTYDNTTATMQALANQLATFQSQYSSAVATQNAALASKYTATYTPIPYAPSTHIYPSQTSTSPLPTYNYQMRPQAEGGLAISNGATDVTFGEKSKELALFLPLDKLSNLLSPGSGAGTSSPANGKMELSVTLSPDLEARIVSKSLDRITTAVTNVRRAR